MKPDVDISFIIPAYNVKKNFLDRCIKSIIEIKKIKYEILLVDDGSSKAFHEEDEKIAQKYKLKYIYKSQGGVGSARNIGINASRGKYIFFVDADDVLISSNFDSLSLAKNYDLYIFDVLVSLDGHKSNVGLSEKKGVLKSKVVIPKMCKDSLMNWSVSKLYKRNFLLHNNISFNEKMISGEDFDFVTHVILNSPSIYYYDIALYIYELQLSTGQQRLINYSDQIINDIDKMYSLRNMLLEKYVGQKNKEKLMVQVSAQAIGDLFEVYMANMLRKDDTDIYRIIRKRSKKYYFQKLSPYIKLKSQIMIRNQKNAAKLLFCLKNLYRKISPRKFD